MPQYYNLTKYSEAENIIEMYVVTDILMKGMFSLFLVVVLGVWITYMRMNRGDNVENAIILGSFYSFLFSLILYISQVIYSGSLKIGLFIFVPAIILIITSVVKWYSNR